LAGVVGFGGGVGCCRCGLFRNIFLFWNILFGFDKHVSYIYMGGTDAKRINVE
jgi:hypothetical protein